MLIVSTNNSRHHLAARERATGEAVFVVADDEAAIRKLREAAESHDGSSGHRLECYLVLSDPASLWLLQTTGLPGELAQKADVIAVTTEDLMAKTVFTRLPNHPSPFPPLDRRPIAFDSDTTVHLLIVGCSPLADAMAINAALVAHYPNYCKDTRLRTRITMIDDHVQDGWKRLTQRYQHLFDNSYWRTTDLSDDRPQWEQHRPMYEKEGRKDFVDVEWEFVNGHVRSEAMRQKLEQWCADSRQQLTIAFCHPDRQRNADEAFSLPASVYSHGTPVFYHADSDLQPPTATASGPYSTVYPLADDCCDIGIMRTLKRLAKRVNYVYHHCRSLSPDAPLSTPAAIDSRRAEELWQQVASLPKRYSCIFNAMTMGTKMHSLGHTTDNREECYALTKEETDLLTEVEHNRWSVEELILGYRPANEEETAQVLNNTGQKKELRDKKIHYDLRAFDDLRADGTGKNVNVYDRALIQAIPLIIKTR